MSDLSPEDIKDPEEDVPPPPVKEPEEDEPKDEEEEGEEKPPDLAAAAYHLMVAVAELARAAGSPPGVNAALDQARIALGK